MNRIAAAIRAGLAMVHSEPYPELTQPLPKTGKLVALPVLGGVQHDHRRAAERVVIRRGQRPLRRDHQDGTGRDASLEQTKEPGDACGGLARAGWTLEEDLALDGALDERELMIRKDG